MQCIKITLATVLSVMLIVSFGLHSVELKHEHHPTGHTHQDEGKSPVLVIDEYVHGIEQKFFLVLLLTLFIFGLSLLPKPWFVQSVLSLALGTRRDHIFVWAHHAGIETDFLRELFRKGILNPKLY